MGNYLSIKSKLGALNFKFLPTEVIDIFIKLRTIIIAEMFEKKKMKLKMIIKYFPKMAVIETIPQNIQSVHYQLHFNRITL